MNIAFEDAVKIQTARVDGNKFLWTGDRLLKLTDSGFEDIGFAIQDLLDRLRPDSVLLYATGSGLMIADGWVAYRYDPETALWAKWR